MSFQSLMALSVAPNFCRILARRSRVCGFCGRRLRAWCTSDSAGLRRPSRK